VKTVREINQAPQPAVQQSTLWDTRAPGNFLHSRNQHKDGGGVSIATLLEKRVLIRWKSAQDAVVDLNVMNTPAVAHKRTRLLT
jgi:hypothetical protein